MRPGHASERLLIHAAQRLRGVYVTIWAKKGPSTGIVYSIARQGRGQIAPPVVFVQKVGIIQPTIRQPSADAIATLADKPCSPTQNSLVCGQTASLRPQFGEFSANRCNAAPLLCATIHGLSGAQDQVKVRRASNIDPGEANERAMAGVKKGWMSFQLMTGKTPGTS